MSENKPDEDLSFEAALGQLTRHSRSSLYLVLVGILFLLGSVYYSATRLRPLEEEINKKRDALEQLSAEEAAQKQRVAELQQQYQTLKTNTEKLYAVRVTPDDKVYELKATAQANGQKTADGRPVYNFSVYVNSPATTLTSIREVRYHFEHDSFRNKDFRAADRSDKFAARYAGWGCLDSVGVRVIMSDGAEHEFDFNMCRSLGPQWS